MNMCTAIWKLFLWDYHAFGKYNKTSQEACLAWYWYPSVLHRTALVSMMKCGILIVEGGRKKETSSWRSCRSVFLFSIYS